MSDRSIGVVDILILYENAATRAHYAGGRTNGSGINRVYRMLITVGTLRGDRVRPGDCAIKVAA